MSTNTDNKALKPLKIKCTSTDCGNNLHCFLLSKRLLHNGPSGRCRSCGAQLIDWVRVHRKDVTDVRYTFEALRFELIRHHFWHIPLSQYALNYARRKGKVELEIAASNQIRRAIGNPNHPRAGRQTPREYNRNANAIHYAQHATASCCRRCLEEWHGIPPNREVTASEIDYLTALAMLYIGARIPDLAEVGVHVPNLDGTVDVQSTAPKHQSFQFRNAS
jgi:hypothetical protein